MFGPRGVDLRGQGEGHLAADNRCPGGHPSEADRPDKLLATRTLVEIVDAAHVHQDAWQTQQVPTRHLALILPGGGYGPDLPVLRLPALALAQAGAEVRVVDYPDEKPRGLERAATTEFTDAVGGTIRAIVATTEPERVTFVAKSLGTVVLAGLGAISCEDVRALWLTPIFGEDYICEGAITKRWPSLVVAGGADPYHHSAAHARVVAATGGRSLLIEGASHSLEVAGDVMSTVEGMHKLAAAVLEFSAAP